MGTTGGDVSANKQMNARTDAIPVISASTGHSTTCEAQSLLVILN